MFKRKVALLINTKVCQVLHLGVRPPTVDTVHLTLPSRIPSPVEDGQFNCEGEKTNWEGMIGTPYTGASERAQEGITFQLSLENLYDKAHGILLTHLKSYHGVFTCQSSPQKGQL